jgi:hypothetical protein
MAIEGGVNTQQPLARIISIHPDGAAYQNGHLKVGEIIQQVDGIELEGKCINFVLLSNVYVNI